MIVQAVQDSTKLSNQFNASLSSVVGRLDNWMEIAIVNLPNIILATLVFFGSYWLPKRLQGWIYKLTQNRISQDSVRGLISNVVSIVVISMGILLALGILNLDTVLKSLLAGAGVAGLAIGLALQGTLSNTFSGIYLSIKDIINIGDWVESNGYAGTVSEISLRSTKIKEADNNIVVIPNQLIIEKPFKNYGLTQRIRVSVNCGVSYDSDLELVKSLAIQAIKSKFPPQGGENIEFYYTDFGGSSIDFILRFWINSRDKMNKLEAKSKAIMTIKKVFDTNEIDIPFPIRTLKVSDPIREALVQQLSESMTDD